MEMAAPYFLPDQPFRIGFEFHSHTFNLAPSEPQRKRRESRNHNAHQTLSPPFPRITKSARNPPIRHALNSNRCTHVLPTKNRLRPRQRR
jgi:hypothetical protein